MENIEITRELSRYIEGLRYESLPPDVVERVKLCFLDWLGVTLGGCGHPLVRTLMELVLDQGGNRQATVVGHDILTSTLQAALVNGSASHTLDFDDVHTIMIGHPSVPVFPAALALAESSGASGKDFIAAYVAGVEVECRVGAYVFPSHYLKGWHSTATLGHFGAAAACANLLQLDADRVIHALGIAGTQAAGLRQVFGSMCKPFHAGKAAMDGLMAALLARQGFTSSMEIIEGRRGFAQVLDGASNAEQALDGLGERYAVDDIVFKYHASCFETHPAIEAILSIREREMPETGEVEEIRLKLSPLAIEVANIRLPQTGLEAKFSQSCCASLALVSGDTGEGAFSDMGVKDPVLIDLMERVVVEETADFSPTRCEAHVRMKDGAVFSSDVDVLHISRTDEERKALLLDKHRSLSSHVFAPAEVDAVVEAVFRLEEIDGMGEVCTLLRPPTAAE
jgi:2-methylcitrate dehydratase PrpD